MSAASESAAYPAKSLPFHSLPLMLAMSLFINSSTAPTPPMSSDLEPTTALSPVRGSETKAQMVTRILKGLLDNYDRRVRPNYGEKTVEVDVTMHISSISSMSEVDMDFTIDFYFRQFWTDPRLLIKEFPVGETQITVGAEMMDKIWVPDTFFPNEKNSFFHQATTTNKFLRILPKGSLYTSVRLTTTLACELDLSYFPLDYQNCSIEIESYGYADSDIQLHWKRDLRPEGQVEFDKKRMKLPQFNVLDATPTRRTDKTGTGDYSRLSCHLTFMRRMGYYVIQIYIPSSLIVVISWVSFWLSRESTPARVSLGVTTVLTMTTLMSTTNAQLPKVSYAKGIDIYLGTCFVMVFASLLEYATVGYSSKRLKMKQAKASRQFPPASGSLLGSQSHTAGSPTKALQHVLGSNHSLHQHHHQIHEHQPLTCRNALSSPGLDTHADTGARFAEHGSIHGRRSVEFRYKSWGSDQSHAHANTDAYPNTAPGNGPVDAESGICRSYSLPRVAPKKKREFKSSEIDKWSRFNLAYWLTYLHISTVPGNIQVENDRKPVPPPTSPG